MVLRGRYRIEGTLRGQARALKPLSIRARATSFKELEQDQIH